MLIFEGSDCRENLLCTLGKLAPQISRLEGATIHVKGRQLRLKIFTLFELCALNAVLGKQGSSATFFDPWTNARLDHIRNHKNKAHNPEYCKEIAFVSIQDLDKKIELKDSSN